MSEKETTLPVMSETLARIETLLWLPGLIYADPWEAFEKVFEDCEHIDGLPEFAKAKEMAEEEGFSDSEAIEEICCALARHKRDGFLAEIAVPVTSNHRPGSYQFCWGHYRSKWIYAKTIEDIAIAAAKFSEQEIENDKSKALGETP